MTAVNEDTPFLAFWRAINLRLAQRGMPDLTFGPAHDLWEDTCRRAAAESFRLAMEAAA